MWCACRKESQTFTPSSNRSCLLTRGSQCTTVKRKCGTEEVLSRNIDIITAAARVQVPDAVVWRGARSKARAESLGGSDWAPAVCARVLEKEVRGTSSSPGWLVVAVDVRVHPSKFLVPDGVP